jgi:hypothetical protein
MLKFTMTEETDFVQATNIQPVLCYGVVAIRYRKSTTEIEDVMTLKFLV